MMHNCKMEYGRQKFKMTSVDTKLWGHNDPQGKFLHLFNMYQLRFIYVYQILLHNDVTKAHCLCYSFLNVFAWITNKGFC